MTRRTLSAWLSAKPHEPAPQSDGGEHFGWRLPSEADALAERIERDRRDPDPQVREAAPVLERELLRLQAMREPVRLTLHDWLSGMATLAAVLVLVVVWAVCP